LRNKQLYAISDQRLILCYVSQHQMEPLVPSPLGSQACNKDEVVVSRSSDVFGFPLRSAYQIIQFLGQILRFQEELGGNRCITLGEDPDKRRCDIGEVLFQVNAPVGTPVVVTRHGGNSYAVYDRPCNRLYAGPCDYSLQVLAILELLLNSNKASSDILSTARVSVVP
jgi:hypothetical protein